MTRCQNSGSDRFTFKNPTQFALKFRILREEVRNVGPDNVITLEACESDTFAICEENGAVGGYHKDNGRQIGYYGFSKI